MGAPLIFTSSRDGFLDSFPVAGGREFFVKRGISRPKAGRSIELFRPAEKI
jgi:hypothetical protein